MIDLAEQHIRESESRLRHIDELMAQAREAPLQGPQASTTEALLIKVQADRDRLAQELEDLRRQLPAGAAEVAHKGEGLKGVLETIGLQLEQALMTVIRPGKS